MTAPPDIPFTSSFAFDLLDHMQDCISCWTYDGQGIYCNKATLDFFSLENVTDFREKYLQIFPLNQPCSTDSLHLFSDFIHSAFEDGQYHADFTFQKLNGIALPSQLKLTPMDHEGKPYILCQLSPKVSFDLEASLNELNQGDALARQLMNASLLPTTLWNEYLEIMDCTKPRLEAVANESSDFKSSFFSLWPEYQPDGQLSKDAAQEYLEKALHSGYCYFTWTYLLPDASYVNAKIFMVRVTILGKYYILSYTFDNALEKISTTSIVHNFDRMQILLKHLPIGIDLWNKDFELFDCNDATIHLFGADNKEDYINNFKSFSPEFQPCGNLSADLIPVHLQEVFKNGHASFEWMHKTKSGESLPLEINIVRSKFGADDVAVVYYKDLREEKRNILEVQKAKQRFKDILDVAPYAICIWNKSFIPIDCNLASLQLYGLKDKDDFFANYHKVIPEYHTDGRKTQEIFVELFTHAFNTGYAFAIGELIHVEKNAPFPVELTLKKIKLDGEEYLVSYITDLSVQHKLMDEIQESHRELSIARDLAEKSSKIKGEFLANMSHEIRTPMNGILGLLHLLSLTELEKQQRFYVNKILFSAESLLRIINDILDFSKIEAGKLEMEFVAFSLADIQEELRTLFTPKFAEKNISGCIFDENVLDTKLIGDPLRLKQVFLNLISNAIKFTETGYVNVSVDNVLQEESNKITYCFSVQDTGIGLSKSQCDKLFSAFSQADASTTRKYGGTGLGLIISKRIVEMMQGTIWVESTLDQGSTFYFDATFELATSVQNIVHSAEAMLESDQNQQEQAILGKILLVEDNEINQIIAVELIEAQGHKVEVAENGQQAMEMIEINDYDMVFMDIQMPIMDGLTATSNIRKNLKFKHLPIVAMSAHAMTGDKEISLKHGMNDHLSKPIQPNALYSSIDYWLKQAKSQMD